MSRWLAARFTESRRDGPTTDPDRARCTLPTPDARHTYDTLHRCSTAWLTAQERFAGIIPQAFFLMEDLFYALYDPETGLNPDVHPAFHWNFTTLATLFSCPEWRLLQRQTEGDPLGAAVCAMTITDHLTSEAALPPGERKRLRRAWARHGRQSGVAGISLPLAVSSDDDREMNGRLKLSKALRCASQRMHEDQSIRSSWGILPGSRSIHHLDDVWTLLELARSLPCLHELTEALERFRSLMQPPASRRPRDGRAGYQRLIGYTLGRDLDRIVPEETVKLADRHLEGLFYEAYEHRRLVQHAYAGEDKRGRGPIVCCMDVSRSMNAPAALGRERFVWTKAVGLAIMDWALRSRRPFLGVCFSSEHELAAFPVHGKGDPGAALAMAQCDFDGGTKFEAPLMRALEFFQEQREREGHLILITDGEAPLSRSFTDDFLETKARLGLSFHCLFIDGGHETLSRLSDRVFYLDADRVDSWESAMRSVGHCLEGTAGTATTTRLGASTAR